MSHHPQPIPRLLRLAEAAASTAAHTNDAEVRAAFTALAQRWKSLAEALAPDHSLWNGRGLESVPGAAERDGETALGITRVPAAYYRYRTYRYTNVDDAIAQAERDLPRSLAAAGA